MKVAPKQKIIRIHKEATNNESKDNYYAKINLSAMKEAATTFSGRKASGFILWCYFAMNQNGYCFALSNEAVQLAMGMKKDAYDNAVELLKNNGNLVQVCGNQWAFYEVPKEVSTHIDKEVSTHFCKQVQTTRNITEDTTIDTTINNIAPPPEEHQAEGFNQDKLPEITRAAIAEMGLTNYSIDGDFFTSATGKQFKLVE